MKHTQMSETLVKRLVLVVWLFALAGADAATSYRNDFSIRTSSVVKTPRTYELAYIPGNVCRPGSSLDETYPYADSSSIQDGWALVRAYTSTKDVFVVTEGDNPALSLVGKNTDVRVVQSFENEFTTGVLKIQADIYTPTAFTERDNPLTWIYPVYRESLDLRATALSAPMGFGPGWMVETSGGQRFTRAYAWTRNSNDATRYVHQTDDNGDITPGNWYRYQFEIDLDAGTYSGTFSDMGTEHPGAGQQGRGAEVVPLLGGQVRDGIEVRQADDVRIGRRCRADDPRLLRQPRHVGSRPAAAVRQHRSGVEGTGNR